MYDKNFIYKMAEKAKKDNTVGIRTNTFRKKTFCISLVTGKVGIAKCHKDDLFDTNYGIGIAYCRLKGIKIKEEQSLKGCIIYCDDEDKEFYVVKDEDSSLTLLEADEYEKGIWDVRAGQKVLEKEKTDDIDLICRKPKMRFEESPDPAMIDFKGLSIKNNRFPIEYFFNGVIKIDENCLATINPNYTLKQNFIMLYYKFVNESILRKVPINKISTNYIPLQWNDNLFHCINTISRRLETLELL